jgi:hypothetical protein
MHILIRLPNWLGDLVMSTAFVRALSQAMPEATIDVIVKKGIDEVVDYPDWFGNQKFHDSHKSNLLKKDFDFYSQYRWSVDPTNPYVWKDKEGKWYEQHSGTKGRVYFESNRKLVSL